LRSKVISRSTKVVDFGNNRKGIFDFLLVINSNLCRISHRFGDTAAYWSKIANSYPPHPHSTPSLGVTPSNFGMNLISPETRVMGPPYGEEIMIVGGTMYTQSTSVTNGQTDRITITKTVHGIASHGKNGLTSLDRIHNISQSVYINLRSSRPICVACTGAYCYRSTYHRA